MSMTHPPLMGDATALRARVLAYLAAHNVMTLATAEPWAAAVFYVNDGFELYFLSSPRSRHCTHLATDPRASATIQEDYTDWRDIKGVQLEGTVEQVAADDEARIRALYGAKFPLLADPPGAGSAIARALARIRWYRVIPSAMHFVDNAAGFGQRSAVAL
jgi:uncharacterized protein